MKIGEDWIKGYPKNKAKRVRDFTKINISIFTIIAIFTTISVLLLGVPLNYESVMAANITNQTVIAKVNVSNTEPNLYLVRITSPEPPIDLTPGEATVVTCNGSVFDVNGYTDIKNVTATLYYNGTASDADDDNNTHYTNSSCGTCTLIEGTNNKNGTCLCNFPVQYYAYPGLWVCNMTVNDTGGLINSENSTLYRINEVLGIDVENTFIDYGNLSVLQTSRPIRENVTNIGNIPINVSVRGYGGGNESTGMNVSMICEAGTNITFGYQRYTLYNDTLFGDMYNLTNQTRQISALTIPKRTNNSHYGNSTNSTFWRLQVPLGASGVCNGTIIFGAIDATTT